jgi:hypothetical protein
MASPIHRPAGFLRVATITRVDPSTMTAYISFRSARAGISGVGTDGSTDTIAQLPISYLAAGGGFIGGLPSPGTPVVVSQAEGASHYFIVAFLARDPAAQVRTSSTQIKIPTLVDGEVTIQANTDGSINLDDDGITIGEPKNSLVLDTTRKISLNTFDYSYFVGQGGIEVHGEVRRDRMPKMKYPSSARLNDVDYDDNLKSIGMDPVSDARNSNIGIAIRNPARIEHHETLFEYEYDADVVSNDQELNFYKTGVFPPSKVTLNRRESRVDALSLSLVAPNYLMESIKGTVVDIFGNIVDINRNIIPIGTDQVASASKIKSTASESVTFNNAYEQIKRLERKSLSYHFEMNARKETGGPGAPPDVNNNENYARLRSRFYLDIDKEGQIKLNVPASTETGNIGLLTRYENYSTVYPNTSSNDPNDMVFNTTYTDVLIEPFANTQVVNLVDDTGNPAGPINRFSSGSSNTRIMHGTAYHDISLTASTLQAATFYNPYPSAEATPSPSGLIATTPLGLGAVQPLAAPIVASQVVVAGANANAGGRSGSLNFDGSLDINIGANTVDRQSLWLDTQGGIVANVGRDLNNGISMAMNLDGQMIIQIGGNTVPAESDTAAGPGRFQGSNTGWMAGVLDIRVFTSNTSGGSEMTVFRIDNGGIQVTTPGRFYLYSAEAMVIRSPNLEIDADTLTLNGRQVLKEPGKGPFR